MKIGKVPETVLKRSVFRQIRHRREEVLVWPGVGKDCSVISVHKDEVLVMSTDPITGTVNEIGNLAVNITANDIAAAGAEMIGIMLNIILPDGTMESDLKEMMQEIEAACEKLNIEVIGGHTEVSDAVIRPIVTVTGVGKMLEKDILTTAGMEPSQQLVMTKWAGLEGTAILAMDKKEQLREKYTESFIDGAQDFIHHISVVKDAAIAKAVGVSAMHDVTEGGIYGALWEMAESSNVGLTVDLKKIPIRQETVEICEFFNLNPYLLISSGCMLMATERGNELVEALEKEGIPAAVIGTVTAGKDRVILNENEKRYLEPPKTDELYKVLH